MKSDDLDNMIFKDVAVKFRQLPLPLIAPKLRQLPLHLIEGVESNA